MSLGASAALREGRLAFQAGNFEAAAERFGAAIAQTPKAALVWVLQAEANYRLRRWREAIAAATRALQLDSGATPAWVRLGATHLKLGDHEEAARNFERALDVDSTRADDWHRRFAGVRNARTLTGPIELRPGRVAPELVLASLGRDLALGAKSGEGQIQERRAREEESPPQWDIGDFIRGRHEVLAVRRGGMAFVYICFDHVQGRPYAVKSLKQSVLDTPGVRESFLREAELWVSLERHPHIVEADLVQVIDDLPVIFLEYIDGATVAGLLAERPIAMARAVEIGLQVCDALQHAHQQGKIIHRDVKPSNILLTKDHIAKVTDFGLALATDRSAEEHGEERRIYGTPQYMAPEQFYPDRTVDRRADVYAFGCTLYEMLTRRWPYQASTALRFREKHEKAPLPDPRQYNTAIRPELVEIIERCLRKAPADRYKGFIEVEAALDRVYRMLTGRERPVLAPPDQMSAVHWIARGTSLIELGKLREAADAFDKAIQIDQELAGGWLGKAEALRILGEYREALRCAIRALAREPRSVPALNIRGICSSMIGEHEAAVRDFGQALEIDPGQDEIRHNQGLALEALGRHEEALACFNRVLTTSPSSAKSLLGKARCLVALEEYEDAVAAAEALLESDPDDAGVWTLKGEALEGLRKWGRAATCYQKVLEIDPENGQARQAAEEMARRQSRLEAKLETHSSPFDRGLRRFQRGRLAEAAAEFEAAVEENPDDERAWRHLSAAYFRMSRYADAEAPARASVRLDPDNAAVHCNLGVVLRKLERWSEARDALMTALRLDPNYLKARVELDKVNTREPRSTE